MSERVCKRCGHPKPLTSFPKTYRPDGSRRFVCHRCHDRRAPRESASAPKAPPKRFRRALKGTRFLITSAQNCTPVHAEFLETLKVAAAALDAEIVIIPLRYKNPTQPAKWQRWVTDKNGEKRLNEDWWDDAVLPYLYNGRKKLCANLVLVGDVKIQPTAVMPLTGFESLTGRESCIIGHPKMALRSVAVPSTEYPKILTTTGACTQRNYSDTRAGKTGEFHHFLGGLVVETDGPLFWLRQINADRADGSFTDAEWHYTREGAKPAPRPLALNTGDTHVRITDPDVDRATFGPGGIAEVLKPERWIVNDVFDGESVNPHEVGDPFIAEAKRRAGRQDVEAEVRQVADFLRERAPGFDETVIVASNHDDFLRRWIVRTDWRGDLKNAAFYLKTAAFMLESARMSPGGAEYGDPFRWWMRELGAPVRCLEPNESYEVGGIENGLHGDRGPNGTRGSLLNLSRLGTKVNSGHEHAPGIQEGHYKAATSTPRRLAYQRGPSSHQNAHILTYWTGKRAIFFIINGRWRA